MGLVAALVEGAAMTTTARGIPVDWRPATQGVRVSQVWQLVEQHDALGVIGRWRFRRRLKRAGWDDVGTLRWRCVEADLLAQGRRDARSAGMYRW